MTESARPHDGAPVPDPQLPAPQHLVTPAPEPDPGDEGARQTAATARSVSRTDEAS